MTNPAQILSLARERGIRIATAESCTGGMVSARLTAVPGSSDVFDRGYVTYSNAAKAELLGVRLETLNAHGAVSEQTAREMADGALKRANSGLAVSITGVAGPGGSERKPEGRVCFGLAAKGADTRTETMEFGAAGRENVREASTDHALAMLLGALT